MIEYVDAAELLADARRKQGRAEEAARRARAKLGTGTRKSGELFYSDGKGALGWLYEDGADPDLVVRDSRFLKKMIHIFKTVPRLRGTDRTTLNLPSGRSVLFSPRTGAIARPGSALKTSTDGPGSIEYAVVRYPRRRGR